VASGGADQAVLDDESERPGGLVEILPRGGARQVGDRERLERLGRDGVRGPQRGEVLRRLEMHHGGQLAGLLEPGLLEVLLRGLQRRPFELHLASVLSRNMIAAAARSVRWARKPATAAARRAGSFRRAGSSRVVSASSG
jgi:hypothetical protein